MKERIEAIVADITTLEVDAIVNAANSTLLGGGGVDGAIHQAAGPDLLQECKRLSGCEVGEAKLTKGYKLPSNYVIHTVGPIYHKDNHDQKLLLANCYTNSLKIAKKLELKTIAFPAISTGVYRYPNDEAAQIAFYSVVEFLKHNRYPKRVIFCCFTEKHYNLYQSLLNNWKS